MSKKEVIFDGFYKNLSGNEKAEVNGVYAVFSCVDTDDKRIGDINLLYIGQAKDQTIAKRHENHEKLDDWKKQCESKKRLAYAFAKVEEKYIDDVEAILIQKNKPVCNEIYPDVKDKNLEVEIIGCCERYIKS